MPSSPSSSSHRPPRENGYPSSPSSAFLSLQLPSEDLPRPSLSPTRPKSVRVLKEQDPLRSKEEPVAPPRHVTTSYSLKVEDEMRIVHAIYDTAKKKAKGSVYSVTVDLSHSQGGLSMGMKDLVDGILIVSLLRRADGVPGPAEAAGIRLGDVLFGMNFLPTRQGSASMKTLLTEEVERKHAQYLHIQGWRCSALCSDPVPGYRFPQADDMLPQAYALTKQQGSCLGVRVDLRLTASSAIAPCVCACARVCVCVFPCLSSSNTVFNENERCNFLEILLSHMVDDLRIRCRSLDVLEVASQALSLHYFRASRQLEAMDLERNIMQAKGLRPALHVRILHTKASSTPPQSAPVIHYILRVEDVESGLQWMVSRRYSDFYSLYETLQFRCGRLATLYLPEIDFPKKRVFTPFSQQGQRRLVETRLSGLESFLRKLLYKLTTYACVDKSAGEGLAAIQVFLEVPRHIDCLHPPLVDDQRALETMAYLYLNDYLVSPAAIQCLKFVESVDLSSMCPPPPASPSPVANSPAHEGSTMSSPVPTSGVNSAEADSGSGGNGGGDPFYYREVLTFLRDALAEVEHFVATQRGPSMLHLLQRRRPDWSPDRQRRLITFCLRRQVEAALLLPLRRTLLSLLGRAMASRLQAFNQAVRLLRQAKATVFGLTYAAQKAKLWPRTIIALRRALLGYLPADQGQLLVEAANCIAALHRECQQYHQQLMMKVENSLTGSAGGGGGGAAGVVEQWKELGSASAEIEEGLASYARHDFSSSSSETGSESDDDSEEDENKKEQEEGRLPQGIASSLYNSLFLRPTQSNTRESLYGTPPPPPPSTAPPATRRESFSEALGRSLTFSGWGFGSNASTTTNTPSPSPGKMIAAVGGLGELTGEGNHHPLQQQEEEEEGLEDFCATDLPQPARDKTSRRRRSHTTIPASSSSTTTAAMATVSQDLLFAAPRLGVAVEELESERVSFHAVASPLFTSLTQQQQQQQLNVPVAGAAVGESTTSCSGNNTTALVPPDRLEHNKEDAVKETVASPASISPVPAGSEDSVETEERVEGEGGPAVDGSLFMDVFQRHEQQLRLPGGRRRLAQEEEEVQVMSADDFLPLMAYCLVHSGLPHLPLCLELMQHLIASEDSYGECGYYLATLEAALQHIEDLAQKQLDGCEVGPGGMVVVGGEGGSNGSGNPNGTVPLMNNRGASVFFEDGQQQLPSQQQQPRQTQPPPPPPQQTRRWWNANR
eukprot:scaffold292_cov161-Ochromonas_danica.AAC.11